MSAIAYMRELAAAVMPSVAEDITALYPGVPTLAWSVSTRDAVTHGSVPRIVWVPGPRDDFQPAQKRTRGGSHAQHSIATRVCGVQCVCWGQSPDATEDLVECLVRALLTKAGAGETGITLVGAAWVDETGMATYGESCTVFFTFPVDVRAQRAEGPARPTVTPQLDTTPATSGDGTVDAGDP